jgi:hypothetical protein
MTAYSYANDFAEVMDSWKQQAKAAPVSLLIEAANRGWCPLAKTVARRELDRRGIAWSDSLFPELEGGR